MTLRPVVVERLVELGKPMGIGNRVVVEQRHPIAGRMLDADVVGPGKPDVFRQADDVDVRKIPFEEPHRAVDRSVVDDHDLSWLQRLLAERDKAVGQEVLAIVIAMTTEVATAHSYLTRQPRIQREAGVA